MTRAVRLLSTLLGVLFLMPALAWADDFVGDFEIEGNDSRQDGYIARLSVEEDGNGNLTVERTERDIERTEEFTWTGTEVRREGELLRVKFAPYTDAVGIAGGLTGAASASVPATAEATYYLTDDGDRIYERVVNLARSGREWRWALGQGERDFPTLKLVREASLHDLLEDELNRYEASGVTYAHGSFYVVFDNDTAVGVVPVDLDPDRSFVRETRGRGSSNFEGLAYDPGRDRFFAVVESDRHRREWRGRVWEFDGDLDYKRRSWLELELASANKGFEGLSFVETAEDKYLLALYEGNHGEDGKKSLDRGHGRVAVFERHDRRWKYEDKIKLPESVKFSDYSGIDVKGDKIAVVSANSSKLWIGTLLIEGDDWKVADEGQIFRFPREKSRILYPAVEGVAWIDDSTVVVVTDRSARQDPPRNSEQGIHVFKLP